MSDNETINFTDHGGRQIRLTEERRAHILDHTEMEQQFERIHETITAPQMIVATITDESVHVYHRYYDTTPVTRNFCWLLLKLWKMMLLY